MASLRQVYRESGPMGVLARGFTKGLSRLGQSLDRLSTRIPCDFRSREARQILARNGIFRDMHKGRRGFVIGNGSSLARQDIGHLRNEITFCMNAFYKHPECAKGWYPTYYFLADPRCFDGTPEIQLWTKEIVTTLPGSTFFVPLDYCEVIRRSAVLPVERTYYGAFYGVLWRTHIRHLDLTRNIPAFMSVSHFAMMTAIYMGCNPIYLIGMDHDWLSHRGIDHHFYQGETHEGLLPPGHDSLALETYQRCAQDVVDLFTGYQRLQTYTQKLGVQIFNATDGGFLDVFWRVKYEDLFTIPGPAEPRQQA